MSIRKTGVKQTRGRPIHSWIDVIKDGHVCGDCILWPHRLSFTLAPIILFR